MVAEPETALPSQPSSAVLGHLRSSWSLSKKSATRCTHCPDNSAGPRSSLLRGFLRAFGPFARQTCPRTFPRCRVRSLLRTGFALLSRHVLRRLLPALAAVRLSQLAQVFEYFRRDAF